MAQIGLFRSAILNEQGQQVIKAVIVGELPAEASVILEAFLQSPDGHVLTLDAGNSVQWLGQ